MTFHPADTLRILLLGEGNLSFSYSLVKKISKSPFFGRYPSSTTGTAADTESIAVRSQDTSAAASPSPASKCLCQICATTFDSEAALAHKYPESEPFLAFFEEKTRVRVRYAGDVNATNLTGTLPTEDLWRAEPFQLIYFNNPHIGIEDQYRHRALLAHTFDAIRSLNAAVAHAPHPSGTLPAQQVVITLCDEQPLRWDLLGTAGNNGFVCVAAVPVEAREFPHFTNRRHQSNAAFPYAHMVQYYFVSVEALAGQACETTPWLTELYQIFRAYEAAATTRDADNNNNNNGDAAAEACVRMPDGRLTLDQWCACVKTLLPDVCTPIADATQSTTQCGAPSPSASAASVHARWRGRLVVPLLDPCVAFYHVESDQCPSGAWYSPYLDLASLPRLYAAQLASERRCALAGDEVPTATSHDMDKPPNDAGISPTSTRPIPAQLDERVLGRPLTQREQVKLQRYLSKPAAPATLSPAVTYSCTDCFPTRAFASPEALAAHTRSQHAGVDQLHPNHHARVHKQIVVVDAESAAATDAETPTVAEAAYDGAAHAQTAAQLAAPPKEAFCAVCQLQFKSRGAYEEHLTFLSPSAVQAEASATSPEAVSSDGRWQCQDCTPPRCFVDKRALVQHRTLKHLF